MRTLFHLFRTLHRFRRVVSVRRREEQLITRLAAMQSRFANLYSAVDSASIVSCTDPRGVIKYVNENFSKISGYDSNELIGRGHNIINSRYHDGHFWRDAWHTIARGQVWRSEVCNRAKNGSTYWVDTFIYPCFDSKGNLKEFFSIRNDITERKLQEQELERSQHLLRAIFDSTSDIYLFLSPDLTLLALNREAECFLQADFAEAKRRLPVFLSLQDGFEKRFAHVLDGNKLTLEREVTLINGRKHWYAVRYLPAYDSNKTLLGVSIVLSDIQVRKKQEIELVRQNQALKDIGWLQSHEVRRPIASILGLVSLLERTDQHDHRHEVVDHLKKMTTELDKKTREIVRMTYSGTLILINPTSE